MNIIGTTDEIEFIAGYFRLMRDIQVIAEINLDDAIYEMPPGPERDEIIEHSRNCMKLVELCSLLLTIDLVRTAENETPQTDTRLTKVC